MLKLVKINAKLHIYYCLRLLGVTGARHIFKKLLLFWKKCVINLHRDQAFKNTVVKIKH